MPGDLGQSGVSQSFSEQQIAFWEERAGINAREVAEELVRTDERVRSEQKRAEAAEAALDVIRAALRAWECQP